MILWRYMSIETFLKATAKDGFVVKASRPADFNDSFECTGIVSGRPSETLVKEYWSLRARDYNLYKEFHFIPGFTVNELGDERDAVLKCLSRMVQQRDFLSQGYRISCFAGDDHDRTYMWSHYGDQSRGVAVAFDLSGIEGIPIQRVEYKERPESVNLSSIDHIDQLQPFFEACVRTKSLTWRVEDEYRVVFSNPENGITRIERNGVFWTIKNEHITKYIVGCEWGNVDATLRDKLRRVINECELDVSKFYMAKRDYEAYDYKEVPFMPYLFA